MGFLVSSITPFSPLGPTTNIPSSKDVVVKAFKVARTDTASTLKAVLPGDASILNVILYGSVASDSATSASVTITAANNSGTVSSGAYDVKANGATTGIVQMSGLPNLQPVPLTGDLKITAVYAEVGASTTGGDWYVVVTYVR